MARRMKIRLLTFASAMDAVGAPELELEIPDGARVVDLKAELDERYPQLEGLWSRLAVAIDGEVADDEQTLSDGAEVALLPPVSGGAPETLSARSRATITDSTLDPTAISRLVESPAFGAVLIFSGNVRASHGGRDVESITYSAYEKMARMRLEKIVSELEAGEDTVRVAIVHRVGNVPVGEASVLIAVASPHRAACYETSRRALERLKAEVPIWKREHYVGGETVWREEESLVGSGR